MDKTIEFFDMGKITNYEIFSTNVNISEREKDEENLVNDKVEISRLNPEADTLSKPDPDEVKFKKINENYRLNTKNRNQPL